MRSVRRLVVALWEGLLFLRAVTPRGRLLPSEEYLQWRLGTVYGFFDHVTGRPRDVEELLGDLWRDRANALGFLTWRRQMRIAARRRT